MLLEINIRNIALIETLRLEFAEGLNVLTGETGAGKSIVVDSVNMALGARVGKDLIRSGAEKASVQALFDATSCPGALQLAEEMGADAPDGLLDAFREITLSGRSVCRVNGVIVPLSQLKKLTDLLVDVHGQHEHQALVNPHKHLTFLDAYGDEAHRVLLDEVQKKHASYRAVVSEIERISLDASERERRADMLDFQIQEIEAAHPKSGEDERLEKKNKLYENAERLSAGIGGAYHLVYSGDSRSMSAQDSLRRASDLLKTISGIDERFDALQARLEETYYAAQDIGYELQDILAGLEYDPVQAEKAQDRLDELRRLKRKYGANLSDVLAFLASAKAEREQLSNSEDTLIRLNAQRSSALSSLEDACARLTRARKALAETFTNRLLDQLADLGMGKTRFEVRFLEESEDKRYTSSGADRVEFMLSPNPGEPMKPLSSIASGGELSRIMLALKAISADAEGVDSMIFDEIDTGVSGRMAQVVGEKMASIARRRQVICVTHLPQIAALAHAHFVVEKTEKNDRTGTGVRRLDREDRIHELARMVGGAGDNASGLSHAEHMLDAAQSLHTSTR